MIAAPYGGGAECVFRLSPKIESCRRARFDWFVAGSWPATVEDMER